MVKVVNFVYQFVLKTAYVWKSKLLSSIKDSGSFVIYYGDMENYGFHEKLL